MAWQPDYATADELRAYLTRSDVVVADDEADFARAISTASRSVDRYTNRQFGLVSAPEARYFTPRYDKKLRKWVVKHDDLMTDIGLSVMADLNDSGVYDSAIGEVAMRPVNAAPKGRPWIAFVVPTASTVQPRNHEASVEVTARWGWTAVPTSVKQATLLQASRLVNRRDAPFGIAGSPDDGSLIRLLSRVDPDVAVVLNPYVRWWGAA